MSLPIITLLCLFAADPTEDMNCIPEADRSGAVFYDHLRQDAYKALDKRREKFELLETPEQIRSYQSELREFFIAQLGGFPEKTPLNAETVGVIEADGYRIEKVIYESQPGHHVTANLYLPDGDGPFPGVLVSSGHSRTAKTADYNQRFAIAMATHGMAALAFDPIGQGERSQIVDENGQPKYSGTTTEHFFIGTGSILVGRNTARYRVWDAIRSVDYLVSRPEIDPDRIGMTGCSGGGTLTSYTMALDDRIVCAAPACYLTTFRALIQTIGPQDAEQNIFGQVAFGLDQPDYVLLRAPKPTIISSTTKDFFDIEGSWDNYRQSKRIYGKLGFPEKISLVEGGGGHGVPLENLAAITQWMQRWLLDKDEPVDAVDYPALAETDLLCTDSGQILTLPGERSVADINAEYAAELASRRNELWETASNEDISDRIRQKLVVRPNDVLNAPEWTDAGTIKREGYHIDKLVMAGPNGPIPALTFHPPKPNPGAYLYLHDGGKLGNGAIGGEIENLVNDGYVVVAIDLGGQGETSHGPADKLHGDWKTFYMAYLLGKSLVGLQTEETIAAGNFVAHYKTKEPRDVHLVAVGQTGIVALHAAALNPTLFASVTLKGTPRDWTTIVAQPAAEGQLASTVHGALELYDLPNLVKLIGEDKVTWEE
ncbi:MAG: acetylxylan esterase [Planctomycetota bacterium]|nr:acetylxylan esterase [Planctomycetota bacterium]MDA1211484.1 acetylxylan esterase [Planctomycetota bacterium]